MSHGGPAEETRQPSWWIWAGVALAAIVLVAGFYGQCQYEIAQHAAPTHAEPPPGAQPGGRRAAPAPFPSGFDALAHCPSPPSVLYHTLQLLVFHSPHLEGPIPFALHLARYAGVLLFFAAGVVALVKLFRGELRLLRLRRQRGHVVICGLGDLGLRLALDGVRRGRFVVAIERQGRAGALEEARAHGVLVLEGDACDPALLRQARVEHADLLVAACPEDHTNVAIAASVGPLVPAGRAHPLLCRLLVQDERTRGLLAVDPPFSPPAGGYRVNFGDLDRHDTAARQVLRRHPLDHRPVRETDDTVVHLIVLGLGPMGRALVRHAARVGHFANEAARGIRLSITVADREEGGEWRDLATRLTDVCTVRFVALDPSDSTVAASLAALAEPGQLATFAICAEETLDAADDQANFRVGLELSRRLASTPAQVLMFQRTRAGFAALFAADERAAHPGALGERLYPFGMVEDVFEWDVLLHESEDALARALHDDFRAHRRREGAAAPPWDELGDNLKDSNRQAADHVAIKLRAAGYHEGPIVRGRPRVERFAPDEILLMAKMEHLRWCAERRVDGWTLGPETDYARRVNPNLVPWDRLDPAEQRKDPEQVLAIPGALARLGRGIYR